MVAAAILNTQLSLYFGKICGMPGVVYGNVVFMAILVVAFYIQLIFLLKTSLHAAKKDKQ